MSWANLFGRREPEQVRLVKAEDHAFADAKRQVLEKIEIAVVDHNGRRLSERRWRDHRDFVRSL